MRLDPRAGAGHCHCQRPKHDARLVVVTGGPGAGKTALLELARRDLCPHVTILPEAAGIVYGGGFPRRDDFTSRRAAQRAIFHVERELEREVMDQGTAALILCDRGTIDAAAYWPGEPAEFWRDVDTTPSAELARYSAVIHLRTPPAGEYNNHNPLRIETAAEAAVIDVRIASVWRDHPNLVVIDHRADFLEKAALAMQVVRKEVPSCCAR
ncbi:MAG: ATP/GTP-binding protein [Polyangia bacterium]